MAWARHYLPMFHYWTALHMTHCKREYLLVNSIGALWHCSSVILHKLSVNICMCVWWPQQCHFPLHLYTNECHSCLCGGVALLWVWMWWVPCRWFCSCLNRCPLQSATLATTLSLVTSSCSTDSALWTRLCWLGSQCHRWRYTASVVATSLHYWQLKSCTY